VTLFEYDLGVLRKFLLLIGCYSSVNLKRGHTDTVVPVHTMKAYGGVEVECRSFLTLALDRSQCSASCPGLFIPPQQGFRTGLDAFDKSKFVAPSGSPTMIPWISSPLPTEAILYKYQILSITLHKPLVCPGK
jgi:hypothetical protein